MFHLAKRKSTKCGRHWSERWTEPLLSHLWKQITQSRSRSKLSLTCIQLFFFFSFLAQRLFAVFKLSISFFHLTHVSSPVETSTPPFLQPSSAILTKQQSGWQTHGTSTSGLYSQIYPTVKGQRETWNSRAHLRPGPTAAQKPEGKSSSCLDRKPRATSSNFQRFLLPDLTLWFPRWVSPLCIHSVSGSCSGVSRYVCVCVCA